ncbi:MAG: HAD family phosphatase [Pseudomonadota bacterium]|nr:MAG: hypothetical protein DIU78_00490 [Pseudomonadota bacterium]
MFELPSRAYSAFIFDCDGTLADSMPQHHAAWCAALAAHGAPFEFGWDLFMRRAGKTVELTVEELNREFGTNLDPRAISRLHREEFARRIPEIRPLEPVVAYLRGVAAKSPVSVASGGERDLVTRTLAAIGVLDLVPVIVTAADVRNGKPAPDMFLLAAERMGVAPEECLVFEDSLLGIEAAHRAGMGAVLVRRERSEPAVSQASRVGELEGQ